LKATLPDVEGLREKIEFTPGFCCRGLGGGVPCLEFPGITDLNYKEEIQIMMSSQILWQFKKRNKIALLLLLPYISINSSNNVWTDGFGSTDQKQSLWTSLVSEYAQPNINIKINNKRFSGLLNTGSTITIISKHLWPKSWPIQKVSCQIVGISQTKV